MATGGFLGVSVFFTLSGFLITSLPLAEQGTSGGVGLRRFWVRRAAADGSAGVPALIIVLTATVLTTAKDTLRGDVLAALADVANWRFYFSGQSYANLFAVPSPVQHYWSLAIEEQFYLVFPLLVWLILVRLKWSRGALAGVVGAGFVGATVASVALGVANADLVYTPRSPVPPSSCPAACWPGRQPVGPPRSGRAAGVVGGDRRPALARRPRRDHGPHRAERRVAGEGGLAASASLSVALIATARRRAVALAAQPEAVRRRQPHLLRDLPYHWPLFLWLTRTGPASTAPGWCSCGGPSRWRCRPSRTSSSRAHRRAGS
jgi:hypothetical protein